MPSGNSAMEGHLQVGMDLITFILKMLEIVRIRSHMDATGDWKGMFGDDSGEH